ncbi:MAG: hypothetical protein V1725_00795 [archaeon]
MIEIITTRAQDYVGRNVDVKEKYDTYGLHLLLAGTITDHMQNAHYIDRFRDIIPEKAEVVVDYKQHITAVGMTKDDYHFIIAMSGTAFIPKALPEQDP